MIRVRGKLQRTWMNLQTIRARLTLWYVALLALILLGFSAFLYVNLSRSLRAEVDRGLRSEVPVVIDELDLDKETPDLENLGDVPTGLVVAVYDRAGERVIATNAGRPLLAPVGTRTRVSQGLEAFDTIRVADGTNWRLLLTPVSEPGSPVGVLQMARSERDVDAALGRLVALMVVAIPLTLLLAVAGGLFLAGRAFGPVDRITRTAESIGSQDLSRRLNLPASPDEMGRLAATFDRMLARLDRAFQRQRRFTADASHELRTPLAMMTIQADVALERRRNAEEYREVIASMRADAARMSQLLGQLLTLARADAGQEDLILEPLVLTDLVDDVVAAMAPLAEARGLQLEQGTAAPVDVAGDQTRLTQLLINLIENGLKYTPAGGVITVSVSSDDAWGELRVADTGVGIAPQHLPHIFERFYRVDEARSRAEGGAGLGLSICQWIARAHGGDIFVTSRPGKGTTLTARLPLIHEYGPSHGVQLAAPKREAPSL